VKSTAPHPFERQKELGGLLLRRQMVRPVRKVRYSLQMMSVTMVKKQAMGRMKRVMLIMKRRRR
jgi:hypothetical protein